MKILHFIDSLNYGGAETLLMSFLPLLPGLKHTVVTLNGPNVYEKGNYEYVQMDMDPKRNFVAATRKLRKIIRKKHIDLVHSHSFWTNIIARFATPANIRVFNHYHFADYDTMREKRAVKIMLAMDKLIGHRKLVRIAVSGYLENTLKKLFPGQPVRKIANFVQCSNPRLRSRDRNEQVLKVVALGNCNNEKNYEVVLEAFEMLRDTPVSIDILGGGSRLEEYRAEVDRRSLPNVRFLGYATNARKELMGYDLFLAASVSETFGMAVLEAVCGGLPLLISDIPAFREISPRTAVFFDPRDAKALRMALGNFLESPTGIEIEEYKRILDTYSAERFINDLKHLYEN
jgi:glycosyltransferase involved in cell wall biosynthesis